MRSSLIKVIAGVFAVLCGGLAVKGATLSEWQRTGSSFDFRLKCEPSATYLIQQSSNLTDWQTIVRSGSGSSNRLLQISASNVTPANRFFRALRSNESLFGFALTARHGIDLNGNDLYVDSFDSALPGRNINGRWDVVIRSDRGDVASNDTLTNSTGLGSAEIFGRIHTGPTGTVSIGPNGGVGSLAWHSSGQRGIQPGYSTDDLNVDFPDVSLPGVVWSAMPSGGTINGTNYDYVFNVSGYYLTPVGSGNIVGKILVIAPNVRLRIDTGLNLTGSDRIELGTNAALTIYMNGTNASFGGQGIVNPGRATNFLYFGTARNTSLVLDPSGETTGGFYAPFADIVVYGGIDLRDFSGALVGNSIRLLGHLDLHFDESLLRDGPKN